VKLSASQHQVLAGMARLGAHVTRSVTAAEIGTETGRTSDSVARTLRSLTARELAERAGFAADCWGYRLTDAGVLTVLDTSQVTT
jgi:DNA-binding MarR family transcriptional regulator